MKEKNRSKHLRTIPSYTQTIPFEKSEMFRPVSQEDEQPSPTLRLKRRASMIKVESSTNILWSKTVTDQMPMVKIKIKAS